MRAAFVAAAALPACSFDMVSFRGDTPFDAAPDTASAEDCFRVGDEDGNGLADCRDPACAAELCVTASGCDAAYVDRISFIAGTASIWFGGDDRPQFMRTIGAGQSLTPDTAVTMSRFGFRFTGGFTYSTTGKHAAQPSTAELDQRDAGGEIVASYIAIVPTTFSGDWLFWSTPPTQLDAGTPYIFTAFLVDAFDQKVNSGMLGDAGAGYAAGQGYAGQAPSGPLLPWTTWYGHPWDFQFRIQERNRACLDAAGGP